MRWIKQYWRVIVRVIGVLMFFTSACIAYLWFYKVAPIRHSLDPSWYRRHSVEAYWDEIRTGIQRSRWGWGHDGTAAFCGDADFMSWVMGKTHGDDDISSCSDGHRDSAFRQITNHDVGESATEWLAWWEENGSKSQEEWIRDGFTAYGVTVMIPPSEADTVPLLTLLGNVSTNETERIPRFVKYNAFRWLRDSEFNPVAYAVSNVTESIQTEIKTGLLEYFRMERIFPKRDHVGELTFDQRDDPYADWALPAMLEPQFKAWVYGLLFGLPCLAVGLTAWTLRKPRHRIVEQETSRDTDKPRP